MAGEGAVFLICEALDVLYRFSNSIWRNAEGRDTLFYASAGFIVGIVAERGEKGRNGITAGENLDI